jgi:threonine dehydratase
MSGLPRASDPIAIGADDIRAAAARIAPFAHRTPVLTSRTLDEWTGAALFFKCENFQRVGAFKFRGALNAVLQLDADERRRGVVTHSSGNHAQALALAGRLAGVPVCVVMPRTAPAVKRAATVGYGARVVTCEPTLVSRESTVAEQIEEHGYILIHPYDDWRVIAGQGTAAWELHEQAGPLDMVITPCGGGGLLAGTALAIKARAPATRVVGAEPAAADDARQSLALGRIVPSTDPRTIADGLRTSLGQRGFAVIRRTVEQIATATEREILDALRVLWERLKIVVEPSSAVALAPIHAGNLDVRGLRVGIILTGGNVDLDPFFQALASRMG